MTHERAIDKDQNIEHLLGEAYASVKTGAFTDAMDRLEQALSLDFETPEIVSSMKSVGFWKERKETLAGIRDAFDRGEFLLGQWKVFLSFCSRIGPVSERCLYALRQFVFGEALASYGKIAEGTGNRDAELSLRIGTCMKRLGDYEQALQHIETASRQKREDAEIYAELADCYAMVNEERASKAFFREAFFLDPTRIDLGSLESGMIRRLIAKVREHGHEPPALEEWIPVYGTIYGVFSVKRELRALEYGKLKQSIYTLETDLKDGKGDPSVLVPRLINRYFWLIDHYIGSKEDRARIDEVLGKLQKLDSTIYEQYTN
jgi:tetratricopeptide (TPR) repeat protein